MAPVHVDPASGDSGDDAIAPAGACSPPKLRAALAVPRPPPSKCSGCEHVAARHRLASSCHRVRLALPASGALPQARRPPPWACTARAHPNPGGERRDELESGRHGWAAGGVVQGERWQRLGRGLGGAQGCNKLWGERPGTRSLGWSTKCDGASHHFMLRCGPAWDPPASSHPLLLHAQLPPQGRRVSLADGAAHGSCTGPGEAQTAACCPTSQTPRCGSPTADGAAAAAGGRRRASCTSWPAGACATRVAAAAASVGTNALALQAQLERSHPVCRRQCTAASHRRTACPEGECSACGG